MSESLINQKRITHHITVIQVSQQKCITELGAVILISKLKIMALLEYLTGILLPFLVPSTHIILLYLFWSQYAFHVQREHCTCSCWDTVFKASYETGNPSFYKHMYFNATTSTMYMWLLIVLGCIGLYEGSKKTMRHVLRKTARPSIVFLFSVSVVSQYRAWWDLINYINDEHYAQIYYQCVASLTEVISTFHVLDLINDQVHLKTKNLTIIWGLSIARMSSRFLNDLYELLSEQFDDDFGSQLAKFLPDLIHFVVPIGLMYLHRDSFGSYRQIGRVYKNSSENDDSWTASDIYCILGFVSCLLVVSLLMIFKNAML